MSSENFIKRQANFFISVKVLQNLKETVPSRKQSQFVEEAIKKELQQKTFFKAMEECKGAWKDKSHIGNTEKFIRKLRESKRT